MEWMKHVYIKKNYKITETVRNSIELKQTSFKALKPVRKNTVIILQHMAIYRCSVRTHRK